MGLLDKIKDFGGSLKYGSDWMSYLQKEDKRPFDL